MAFNKERFLQKGYSQFFAELTDFKSRAEQAAIHWINQKSDELAVTKKGMMRISHLNTTGEWVVLRKNDKNVYYSSDWRTYTLEDGGQYPLLNVTVHGFSTGSETWTSKPLAMELFEAWKNSNGQSNVTPIDQPTRHFNQAKPLRYSQYLVDKNLAEITNLSVNANDKLFYPRFNEDKQALTLPMLRINGGGYELAGVQWIYENPEIKERFFKGKSNKQFLAGTKTKGCLLPLFFKFEGKLSVFKLPELKTSTIYLAEGYATALACHLATGNVSICCYSADNIESIVILLKGFGYSSVVIAADNDLHLKNQWLDEIAARGFTPESEGAKEIPQKDSESKARLIQEKHLVAIAVPSINSTLTEFAGKKVDFADVFKFCSPVICKKQLETLIKPVIHVSVKAAEAVKERVMPLPPPNTLLFELMQDILETLYIQQIEVAACAALVTLSALMQRQVTTPIRLDVCSGFFILAGAPGSGKDGAASAIAMIDAAIHTRWTDADIEKETLYAREEMVKKNAKRVLGFITPASPQGINKELAKKERPFKHQTVVHFPECGAFFIDAKLISMVDYLKNAFTGKTIGKKTHSDDEKNVEAIERATITVLGDTTLNAIMDGLSNVDSSNHLASHGWLSRLLVFTLPNTKPIVNRKCKATLTNAYVINELRSIAENMEQANREGILYSAQWDDKETEKLYFAYDDLCRTTGFKFHESEVFLQEMYVRRAQIALRIATLVAAFGEQNEKRVRINGLCCDPFRITKEIFEYARDLVDWAFDFFVDKKQNGEIGAGDREREDALCEVLNYYVDPYNKDGIVKKYKERGVTAHLVGEDVIPHSYLSTVTGSKVSFKRFQGGANKALALTIEQLMKTGVLSEVSQQTLDNLKSIGYTGRGLIYQIHKKSLV